MERRWVCYLHDRGGGLVLVYPVCPSILSSTRICQQAYSSSRFCWYTAGLACLVSLPSMNIKFPCESLSKGRLAEGLRGNGTEQNAKGCNKPTTTLGDLPAKMEMKLLARSLLDSSGTRNNFAKENIYLLFQFQYYSIIINHCGKFLANK